MEIYDDIPFLPSRLIEERESARSNHWKHGNQPSQGSTIYVGNIKYSLFFYSFSHFLFLWLIKIRISCATHTAHRAVNLSTFRIQFYYSKFNTRQSAHMWMSYCYFGAENGDRKVRSEEIFSIHGKHKTLFMVTYKNGVKKSEGNIVPRRVWTVGIYWIRYYRILMDVLWPSHDHNAILFIKYENTKLNGSNL